MPICQTGLATHRVGVLRLGKKSIRVAIFCRARPGLVQAITSKLHELGANLGPTSFALLGKGAEFTSVVSVEADREIWEFDSAILVMPELVDAQISVHEYAFDDGDMKPTPVNMLLTVAGIDRPGLLANLTEFLLELDLQVVRMTTEIAATEQDAHFTTRLTVWIDPDNASDKLDRLTAYADQHKLTILPILL